jgi:hypothetical protein
MARRLNVIQTLEVFKTSDSRLFLTNTEAHAHESDLNVIKDLRELFEAQASYNFGQENTWSVEVLIESRHAIRTALMGGVGDFVSGETQSDWE